ncbi:hypothetical protein GCM10007207_15620 [Asaia siamensis]|uniref:Uncharacterized protein n=1 Tax=Asaia siamensis TaxID=110479 RepID=A0ABQ1LXU7_9PROT|nr:hypothetical protein AA0323_0080 [Asaia siamensis NRIC 0323]GGC30964.1 hypothetical protein GCM10007207_15620 [Asaia siamensis]
MTVTVGDIAKALKSPLTQEEARNVFNNALKAYQAYQNADATTGEPQAADHTGKNETQAQPSKRPTSAETVGADLLPPNDEDPEGNDKPSNSIHEGK